VEVAHGGINAQVANLISSQAPHSGRGFSRPVPKTQTIAKRLNTGIAQVIFRFAQQIGMLSLTGTTSEQHMKEDLQAERFTLSAEELQRIETIAV
jgi:diketogulonate reductase-like aldo/keto reductase